MLDEEEFGDLGVMMRKDPIEMLDGDPGPQGAWRRSAEGWRPGDSGVGLGRG